MLEKICVSFQSSILYYLIEQLLYVCLQLHFYFSAVSFVSDVLILESVGILFLDLT